MLCFFFFHCLHYVCHRLLPASWFCFFVCFCPECRLGCPVYCEDYSSGEFVRKLPCLHYFHSGCIVPWLELVRAGSECSVMEGFKKSLLGSFWKLKHCPCGNHTSVLHLYSTIPAQYAVKASTVWTTASCPHLNCEKCAPSGRSSRRDRQSENWSQWCQFCHCLQEVHFPLQTPPPPLLLI